MSTAGAPCGPATSCGPAIFLRQDSQKSNKVRSRTSNHSRNSKWRHHHRYVHRRSHDHSRSPSPKRYRAQSQASINPALDDQVFTCDGISILTKEEEKTVQAIVDSSQPLESFDFLQVRRFLLDVQTACIMRGMPRLAVVTASRLLRREAQLWFIYNLHQSTKNNFHKFMDAMLHEFAVQPSRKEVIKTLEEHPQQPNELVKTYIRRLDAMYADMGKSLEDQEMASIIFKGLRQEISRKLSQQHKSARGLIQEAENIEDFQKSFAEVTSQPNYFSIS
jgi:Retrotransposon gag protein